MALLINPTLPLKHRIGRHGSGGISPLYTCHSFHKCVGMPTLLLIEPDARSRSPAVPPPPLRRRLPNVSPLRSLWHFITMKGRACLGGEIGFFYCFPGFGTSGVIGQKCLPTQARMCFFIGLVTVTFSTADEARTAASRTDVFVGGNRVRLIWRGVFQCHVVVQRIHKAVMLFCGDGFYTKRAIPPPRCKDCLDPGSEIFYFLIKPFILIPFSNQTSLHTFYFISLCVPFFLGERPFRFGAEHDPKCNMSEQPFRFLGLETKE